MAWASVGAFTVSTVANTANNQASITITPGSTAAVGTVVVASISQDNAGSTDTFVAQGGTGVCVTTMSDSAGNTWLRAGEFENGNAAAQAGVVCSVWYSQLTAGIGVADTITATFLAGSSASFDESAMSLWQFSVDPFNSVAIAAATGAAADATTAPGSMDQSVAAGEYLRFRAIASETSVTTALTTSAGWTAINPVRSANVATATGIRGEWRIVNASTAASAGSFNTAADHASVYVVFREVSPTWLIGQSVL